MMYLLPTTAKNILKFPREKFGVFLNPRNVSRGGSIGVKNGYFWAMDNDCFNEFNHTLFLKSLMIMNSFKETCLFITAPDVMSNALHTLSLYRNYLYIIKSLDYPIAFVAQDGISSFYFPEYMDYLFLGGSTEFKEGNEGRKCINYAKKKEIPIHVGRVNSERRLNIFKIHACDTCDGTDFIRGPNKKINKYKRWMNQPTLFSLEE